MIQARLSRGNLNNHINVSKLPDDIKDSFAKTRLRSLITSSLQPLVDYFRNYKNIVLDITLKDYTLFLEDDDIFLGHSIMCDGNIETGEFECTLAG